LIARTRTPYRIASVDDKTMAVLPGKDFSLLRFAAAMLTIGALPQLAVCARGLQAGIQNQIPFVGHRYR
jgi:hypothetical protein